jgi:hypothetical protein
MSNPWNEVPLDVYETHMGLSSVGQLQMLASAMKEQFCCCKGSVAIFGIAGGNGLEQIPLDRFSAIYGIDVNPEYLEYCGKRYEAKFGGRLHLIHADLSDPSVELPAADAVIADLFVEYVGEDSFAMRIDHMKPSFVSCVFQKNETCGFVSVSPYTKAFDPIESICHDVEGTRLDQLLQEVGYRRSNLKTYLLPNGKHFVRMDWLRM